MTRTMVPYVDFHTHQINASEETVSVYNLLLPNCIVPSNVLISAGLHPWHADKIDQRDLALILEKLGSDQRLMALGETGLDKKSTVSIEIQKEVFEFQMKWAIKLHKPLVIHCHRAWDEMILLTNRFPFQKIVHGFHESLELTTRLVKEKFHFSIGAAILNDASRLNQSIHGIPLDQLHFETDESTLPIEHIYSKAAEVLKINLIDLKAIIYQNFLRTAEESRIKFFETGDYHPTESSGSLTGLGNET